MDQAKKENLSFFINRNIAQLLYVQNPGKISPFFPVRLYIEPTNACNLRCIHCHHNNIKKGVFKRKVGMMDFGLYKKVISEIEDRHCEISLNAQGEPLLHKDIIRMVEYAIKKNIFVSLLTNATLLSEKISKELVSLGLNRIVFSFDSIDKNEFEKIRVNAKFEQALLNILEFLKINEGCGHPTFVCCSAVIQQANIDSICRYDEYFHSLPIDTIFHSTLLNLSGNSGVSGEIDIETKRKMYQKDNFPICRVPWEMMSVNWDGEVSVCGLDFNVLYSIGNVKDFTLFELWNKEEMQTFRKAHLEQNFALIEKKGDLCSKCNCLFDAEYNIRNYKLFTERDLLRKFQQYSIGAETAKKPLDEVKYNRLQEEIKRLDSLCRQ